MDKKQLLWQLSAEQFAALEIALYLDTHPHDGKAMEKFDAHQEKYLAYKKQYEEAYGPITIEYSKHKNWNWVNDPWPWQREAN